MEVFIPVQQNMDFDFNSVKSVPTSPRKFGDCVFSAPTSPNRMSEFYREFDNFLISTATNNLNMMNPDPHTHSDNIKASEITCEDFAFDMAGNQSEEASLTADELFDGGKIKASKTPSRFEIHEIETIKSPLLSPKSPKFSSFFNGGKKKNENFSPRKKKDLDPFEEKNRGEKETEEVRGRGRTVVNHSSSRRNTRSLSPYRVSAYPWEEEEEGKTHNQHRRINAGQVQPSNSSSTAAAAATRRDEVSVHNNNNNPKSSSRKWRLRDFLLFRSASEGRANDKDRFWKHSVLFRRHEDGKHSSFRSSENGGGGGGVGLKKSKGGQGVSAHELHYTANKAASEDLKKKTFLPYKHGILGRFAFSPSVYTHAKK